MRDAQAQIQLCKLANLLICPHSSHDAAFCHNAGAKSAWQLTKSMARQLRDMTKLSRPWISLLKYLQEMQRTIPTQLLQDRRIHMLSVSHLDNSQASIIMDSAVCTCDHGCALLHGGMHANRQTSRVIGELFWKAFSPLDW